jgi:signal transduction histidine kinase
MNVSSPIRAQLTALASYLAHQRDAILQAWREAVNRDPEVATASTISRAQFNDHVPEVLDAFEKELRGSDSGASIRSAEQQSAAEHGLHRWQQGYDQRETMREWGHLHLCVLDVIEHYGSLHPDLAPAVMPHARRALVGLCNGGVCESAARFAWLQRMEAAGRVRELEQALEHVKTLERERAETWREAAHDLRGSVSAISSAAAIVGRDGVKDSTRVQFSNSLRKSVVSLHNLLSDLMSLARLEAGHDRRNVAPFDAGQLMREFCDAMRPLAQERGLFLGGEGPQSLATEGDPAKVRRIAQNLVLNALNVTERGGIKVAWQKGPSNSVAQWVLSIQDTGPGFAKESAPQLARALKEATEEAHEVEERAEAAGDPMARAEPPVTLASQSTSRAPRAQQGEGIGLSIVKRLCEALDASLELESAAGKGTTFRVVFPCTYPQQP